MGPCNLKSPFLVVDLQLPYLDYMTKASLPSFRGVPQKATYSAKSKRIEQILKGVELWHSEQEILSTDFLIECLWPEHVNSNLWWSTEKEEFFFLKIKESSVLVREVQIRPFYTCESNRLPIKDKDANS